MSPADPASPVSWKKRTTSYGCCSKEKHCFVLEKGNILSPHNRFAVSGEVRLALVLSKEIAEKGDDNPPADS